MFHHIEIFIRKIVQAGVASQKQSQVIRGRSSIAQLPKRTSTRRVSEMSKEAKIGEIPMGVSTPPSGPPGTIVDEAETVPEPAGPKDEVVSEASFQTNQEEEAEEKMPSEAEQ